MHLLQTPEFTKSCHEVLMKSVHLHKHISFVHRSSTLHMYTEFVHWIYPPD